MYKLLRQILKELQAIRGYLEPHKAFEDSNGRHVDWENNQTN